MIFQINKKKIITVFTAILLVVVVLLVIFNFVLFRITGTDPSGNKIPTSQSRIVIYFNKPLSNSNNISQINLSLDIVKEINYRKDSIQIDLTRTVLEDEELILYLNDIKSESNQTVNKEIILKGAYIGPSKLSSQELERQVKESDSFEKFTLVSILPYYTKDYEINYRLPDDGEAKMPIIITTLKIPSDPSAELNSQAMYEVLRETRTNAIAWLKDNGYNDNDYRLEFTEPVLYEEFGGKPIKYLPLD
jgi:hypothetical protein